MQIHPRTLAATFRDMARETEAAVKSEPLGSTVRDTALGKADGLRTAAEQLEQLADAEFERIMAETPVRPGERSSEYAMRVVGKATDSHPVRS